MLGLLGALVALFVLALAPASQEATLDDSASPAPTPASSLDVSPLSESDIASLVTPSVVQIFAGDSAGSGVALGSGIVTNAHVVGNASQVQIATSDGRTLNAFVARTDLGSDLALLLSEANLPALTIEPSTAQHQGDPILVFGYPLGIGGEATLTRGVVSALRQRPNGVALLQTDATTNPGNSGGPMVNSRGHVVAITEFTISDSVGLNFGIGGETVDAFLNGASFPVPQAATPVPTMIAPPLSTTVPMSPQATNTPTVPAHSPLFVGSAMDVNATVADLGPDWIQTAESMSPANEYSPGRNFRNFRSKQTQQEIVTTAEAYRSLDTPTRVTSQYTQGPAAISGCDASSVTSVESTVTASCRVVNVILEVWRATSTEQATSMLHPMIERVRSGPFQ